MCFELFSLSLLDKIFQLAPVRHGLTRVYCDKRRKRIYLTGVCAHAEHSLKKSFSSQKILCKSPVPNRALRLSPITLLPAPPGFLGSPARGGARVTYCHSRPPIRATCLRDPTASRRRFMPSDPKINCKCGAIEKHATRYSGFDRDCPILLRISLGYRTYAICNMNFSRRPRPRKAERGLMCTLRDERLVRQSREN